MCVCRDMYKRSFYSESHPIHPNILTTAVVYKVQVLVLYACSVVGRRLHEKRETTTAPRRNSEKQTRKGLGIIIMTKTKVLRKGKKRHDVMRKARFDGHKKTPYKT